MVWCDRNGQNDPSHGDTRIQNLAALRGTQHRAVLFRPNVSGVQPRDSERFLPLLGASVRTQAPSLFQTKRKTRPSVLDRPRDPTPLVQFVAHRSLLAHSLPAHRGVRWLVQRARRPPWRSSPPRSPPRSSCSWTSVSATGSQAQKVRDSRRPTSMVTSTTSRRGSPSVNDQARSARSGMVTIKSCAG